MFEFPYWKLKDLITSFSLIVEIDFFTLKLVHPGIVFPAIIKKTSYCLRECHFALLLFAERIRVACSLL